MNKRAVLPIILLLLPACPAFAATVEQLLHQLEHGDWAERQSAEDALTELGEPAVEPLRAALAGARDLELRERLQSALTRIGRDQLLSATRVSIKQTFPRPLDAFQALADSLGVTLRPASDQALPPATEARPVEVSIEQAPWLSALSQVIASTGIDARLDDGTLVILSEPPRTTGQPTDWCGALAVGAGEIRVRKTMQLPDGIARGTSTLRLDLQCEPKLRFRSNQVAVRIERLEDEAGRAVLDAQGLDIRASGSGGRLVAQVPIGAPENLPKRIALLSGVIEGEMVLRSKELSVDQLSTLPRSVELPEGELQIVAFKPAGQAYELQLRYSRMLDTMGTGRSVLDGMTVYDAAGRTLSYSRRTDRRTTQSVEAMLQIQPIDPNVPPARLVWVVPALTREVRIPFVLRDLAMPK